MSGRTQEKNKIRFCLQKAHQLDGDTHEATKKELNAEPCRESKALSGSELQRRPQENDGSRAGLGNT